MLANCVQIKCRKEEIQHTYSLLKILPWGMTYSGRTQQYNLNGDMQKNITLL